jgi:protein-S-isoprenylcysteine O-methyltransferase Ste14
MTESFKRRFLDRVCPWDSVLAVVFGINVVLLVMLGVTLFFEPRSEGTRVITQLSLVLILVTLAIVTLLLRLCQTRQKGGNADDD